MSNHQKIRDLVRKEGVAVLDMFWMAGVDIDNIPDALRQIIEEEYDAESLGELFSVELEGFLPPEHFSAEEFFGVLFQKGASLDGFFVRVGFPARYYGPEGEVLASDREGYQVDFFVADQEELIKIIEDTLANFDKADRHMADQVRSGTPIYSEEDLDESDFDDSPTD